MSKAEVYDFDLVELRRVAVSVDLVLGEGLVPPHDVVRLKISVGDAELGHVGAGFEDLFEHCLGLVVGDPSALFSVDDFNVAAFAVLSDEVYRRSALEDLVELQNVGVVQLSEHLDLFHDLGVQVVF